MVFMQVKEKSRKTNCFVHISCSGNLRVVAWKLVVPFFVMKVNFIILHSALASICAILTYEVPLFTYFFYTSNGNQGKSGVFAISQRIVR